MRGKATRGNAIQFGDFGLVALEPAWITSRQIEAARIAMTRHIKRGGQVWIRIFPDKPITKKPLEQRMGKGKAPVEGWVAVVKPDRVLFEMDGVPEEVAREAMRLAMFKLPIRCKFIQREGLVQKESGGKSSETSTLRPEVMLSSHGARADHAPTTEGESTSEES